MGQQEQKAKLKGRLSVAKGNKLSLPAVGDYVEVELSQDSVYVTDVKPRRNVLSRKVAGTREELQIIASNVDYFFIVMALDADFSLPRLERYLALADQESMEVVAILSKADLNQNLAARCGLKSLRASCSALATRATSS